MERSVFDPATLRGLRLRNRVIKSATDEGMVDVDGVPTPALTEHHRRLATGGVGLTTVAYCAVSPRGRTFENQLQLHGPAHGELRRLTDAVHVEGGAASLQLTHCGSFTRLRSSGARSASSGINVYGIATGVPFHRPMTDEEIAAVVEEFGVAASTAVELGFDAVEIHMGHGYLLSQFLSPAKNRRRDAWGGDPQRRRALPLAVIARVREAVGEAVPIIVKTNLSDGFRGGLTINDAVGIALALQHAGVDLLIPSGGWVSRAPFYLLRGDRPLKSMIRAEASRVQRVALRTIGPAIIRRYPFEPRFFQPLAETLRAPLTMPVALLGGVVSRDDMDAAIDAGFSFVAMARALIADPDLVVRMQRGEITRTRCTACNECVALRDMGGVRCALDEPA